MTLDQALYLLGALSDTVRAQQAQIDQLTAQVQALAQLVPAEPTGLRQQVAGELTAEAQAYEQQFGAAGAGGHAAAVLREAAELVLQPVSPADTLEGSDVSGS